MGMNTGLGLFLYIVQTLAAVGAFVADRGRIKSGFPITAKAELLGKIDQAKTGAGEALVVGGQWAGFCFLALLGMAVFAFGLRSPETRRKATQFIAAGGVVCVAAVLWPLAA